jgi:hypothetical protein
MISHTTLRMAALLSVYWVSRDASMISGLGIQTAPNGEVTSHRRDGNVLLM